MLLRRKLPVLWAALVGALVAAIVVSFFVFVQGGEAAPQAADKQPSASVSPMIVGGTEVSDGKYPFMALLDFRTPKGEFLDSCGASLIDQDSVLTAAHCLAWLPSAPFLKDGTQKCASDASAALEVVPTPTASLCGSTAEWRSCSPDRSRSCRRSPPRLGPACGIYATRPR